MTRISFDAGAAITVDRPVTEVWEWINRLPQALESVPIIRAVEEVIPDERYILDLGSFGAGNFEIDIRCDMRVHRDPPREAVFETVAGTGNADVRMSLSLEAVAPEVTTMTARIVVSPHPDVPRLFPVKPVVSAARATVGFGLERGLERMKRDLEAET